MDSFSDKSLQTKDRTKLAREAAVLVFSVVLFGYLFSSCSSSIREKPQTDESYKPLETAATSTPDPFLNADFASFKHDGTHQTIPCLICHQREEGVTKPKFASHQTCNSCHSDQFADKNHQICTTCHTATDSSELKPFPTLKTHTVKFDHSQHKQADCSKCHQNNGKSVSIPAGANGHQTCWQCHTPNDMVGEKNLGSCSTCHGDGNPVRLGAKATNIGFNFSHSSHSKVSCESCHSSQANGNYSAINVGMHSGGTNNCAECHNEKRAFGANDFSDCRKCHTEVSGAKTIGVKFSHAKHTKSKCATCHKGTGASFSVPNGQSAHTTCFQCHEPMKGANNFTSGKCFQCHQIGGGKNLAGSSGVIAGGFNHTKHSFYDCDSCHKSANGVMSNPAVLMHKATKSAVSCKGCHDNSTAFGTGNFSDCKRCHTGKNFNPGSK